MTSIKITSADKVTVQDTGETMLSVLFEIQGEDGKTLAGMRHGFPLDVSPEKVEDELKNVLETYLSDLANAARNATSDRANEVADTTIADIIGMEIKN